MASQGEQILLHGDLHYANILWSEQNGWLAIDPQNVIGEREFDIPFPRLEKIIDKKLLQYRLAQFIEISGSASAFVDAKITVSVSAVTSGSCFCSLIFSASNNFSCL
ncbi:MAG: hypothetical protein JSR33_08260 [Proteobacteria bacterium]|nr:hypothetical protein [Pseudomonadota bacterium]